MANLLIFGRKLLYLPTEIGAIYGICSTDGFFFLLMRFDSSMQIDCTLELYLCIRYREFVTLKFI